MKAKDMSESKRLELIAEAVRYCQRVSAMGMPASVFSKALREPIHFLWERRAGSKTAAAQYRSISAVGLSFGKGKLVYDHAVPFICLQRRLLVLDTVDEPSNRALLERLNLIALITKDEDEILKSAGLNKSMPKDWDGNDPLARYREMGIELIPNRGAVNA
ncbi:hypothetical protein [Halomonas nitroreducens]|uniref:Uncharacterized protein n=1 Tax=Halomonas nitroreducens TaxID=447425 RepID=A0A3S0JVQ0_9GAMM|nr:hypothetical protein [Halomonas nitroreducens]RTQ99847.1 hypothetical protein EKG36_16560 [Halomonas nitroreducens]